MASNTENNHEDDDNDESDRVSVTFGRGGKKGNEHDPVQNDQHVPIFPEMGKDSRNVITGLQIHKLTMPGEGFKGVIPPSSTLETIGRKFGNGRYNIHAVNQENRVLRRLNDIPISISDGPESNPQVGPRIMHAAPDMTLLNFQATQHEKDASRIESFAKESNQQNREMTEKHLKMVEAQSLAQTVRDREFFQATAKSQQDFFAGVLAFTQSSFQQLMTLQSQQFQQTITLMEQGHQRALASSDPMLLLTLFKSGLETGRDLQGENDDNPVVKTAQTLLGGVTEVRKMMMLKNAQPPANLGLPPGQTSAVQAQADTKKPKEKPANKPAQAPAESGAGDQATVLQKLMKLRQTLEAKGVDFEDYLAQVQSHIESLPDEPDDTDESEENEPEEDGGATSENGAATRPT